MIASLNNDRVETKNWLQEFYIDFRRRILKLLPKSFTKYNTALGLSILDNKYVKVPSKELSQNELNNFFTPHDVQRLESYVRNQIEYRLILDLTNDLSSLFFQMRLPNAQIDAFQKAILLGIGTQNKNLDQLSSEFNMPSSQVLAKFYDTVKKLTKSILNIMQQTIESEMLDDVQLNEGKVFKPLTQTMDEELDDEVKKLEKKQKKELVKLKKESLSQYAIKGDDKAWSKALQQAPSGKKSIISVASGQKRNMEEIDDGNNEKDNFKKSKKKKFHGKKDKFFK